jgi:hypothetical protein
MTQVMNLSSIYQQVEMLDNVSKIDLLQKIISSLKLNSLSVEKKHSLSELKGLGKALWKNVDIENYINQERNSW